MAEMIEVLDTTRARFTRPLLQWYQTAGRNLPWRKTSDPYEVWVSEIMLQQTQVSTVLPYYHRFLSAFPTIQDLAAADLEKVLKSWQGLGYYARARHLHSGARIVVDQFGGKVPSTFEQLKTLPGIGRSTAGAILTIAFGQRHPILDGNVKRVLCRFFAVEKEPREKSIEAWLWRCSEALLPRRGSAGCYLQAIMDLGATCCTPKRPQCECCPLKKSCGAFQKGLQHQLPIKRTPKKIPHFNYFSGVITCGEAVLIRRRPLKGLLAGLWEFPGERVDPGAGDIPIAESYERFFNREMQLCVTDSQQWMTIRHVFTHFKMTLHVFSCHLEKRTEGQLSLLWVPRDTLNIYPFSTAQQKIVSALSKLKRQGRHGESDG